MSKAIESLEGIGTKNGEKLRSIKINTHTQLLEQGATKKGRKEISKQSGISEADILRFVNMADLFRVKGVATQYAELLKATGVDTVKELRNRKPANLAAAMKTTNAEKKLCKQVPSEKMVEAWVSTAKSLDPVVSH